MSSLLKAEYDEIAASWRTLKINITTMKKYKFLSLIVMVSLFACTQPQLNLEVYETSEAGNQLTKIEANESSNPNSIKLKIDPEQNFQKIIGFGGAFTESSAFLLNQMSEEKRQEILEAYFGNGGARYSLTRTHINSCDFSLSNYSYAPVEGDIELNHFSIEEDMNDIIPMIKQAQAFSKDGFKILSSPWTAPPWMKDNNNYVGGKLLPEHYSTWALFFSKYISAYADQGIDIWGLTIENEPLGNGNNWESMHFSPEETVDFTNNFLGPKLESDGHDIKIYGYDQNRDHLKHWADVMYKDEASSKYFDGMAVHWYASTYDWMPETLEHTHKLAPEKPIIQSEACVDAEVPHWNDDPWYWKKEATDWGWDWAPDEEKHLHPKYAPVYRYASDIIGCMNSWVAGWIDWNMVLDTKGGPNWANNWCIAPVIVNPETDEVYYTPLYYVMTHFSKYIRPGAVRIGLDIQQNDIGKDLMVTAIKNPDNSIVLVVLNMSMEAKTLDISLGKKQASIEISKQAIQTITILE